MNSGIKTIGWIGYGSMGRPMCVNLLKAGYTVQACDIDPTKVRAMRDDGVRACASPRSAAEGSDLVASMIWSDETLQEIVSGENGLAHGIRRGVPYVDMSTVSPGGSRLVAEQLEARGIPYLRSPVSGSALVAKTAGLTIYASGPRETFDRCLPVLKALSANQTYVGIGEESRVLKLTINLMVAMSTAVLGEALSFGTRAGLDRSLVIDAVNDSIVGSRHYAVRADAIKRRDLSSTGSWAGAKDVGMAMSLAQECGAVLPIASLVQQYVTLVANRGVNRNGVVALATLIEDINPITPRGG
jgi:3-hydroxyisobutyrate dehydrogenase-like beta-hydroxyacid dehydrogenase